MRSVRQPRGTASFGIHTNVVMILVLFCIRQPTIIQHNEPCQQRHAKLPLVCAFSHGNQCTRMCRIYNWGDLPTILTRTVSLHGSAIPNTTTTRHPALWTPTAQHAASLFFGHTQSSFQTNFKCQGTRFISKDPEINRPRRFRVSRKPRGLVARRLGFDVTEFAYGLRKTHLRGFQRY